MGLKSAFVVINNYNMTDMTNMTELSEVRTNRGKNVNSTGRLYHFDFTKHFNDSFALDANIDTKILRHLVNDVKGILNRYCKKWVFQLERGGETNRLHLQGRISTRSKVSLKTLIGYFSGVPGFYFSITSTVNLGNTFYVTKEETRVKGPWKDTDVENNLPFEILDKEMFPYQRHIFDDHLSERYDERTINVNVEFAGNRGRSIGSDFITSYKVGYEIPPFDDMDQIARAVYDLYSAEKRHLFVVDMPKATDKKKIKAFWAGIEKMKDGKVWDQRHHFKQLRMERRPNIWILTNEVPDIKDLMSPDRFQFWQIDANNEFVNVSYSELKSKELEYKESQKNFQIQSDTGMKKVKLVILKDIPGTNLSYKHTEIKNVYPSNDPGPDQEVLIEKHASLLDHMNEKVTVVPTPTMLTQPLQYLQLQARLVSERQRLLEHLTETPDEVFRLHTNKDIKDVRVITDDEVVEPEEPKRRTRREPGLVAPKLNRKPKGLIAPSLGKKPRGLQFDESYKFRYVDGTYHVDHEPYKGFNKAVRAGKNPHDPNMD